MAATSGEGLSTIPNSSINNSVNSEVHNVSRSPSLSSMKDYTWSNLLMSKNKKNIRKIKG